MNARMHSEAGDDDPVVFCLTSASRPYSRPEIRAERYGVGSVLAGKYRLDSILGEGSIGTVWQATNLLLDSPVAIKLTHAELAGPEFRARLQLEARAAAGVGHPGIIRIFDVAETDFGDPFIVMELLQGATLAQMIAGGTLTPIRAVQLVLPIVDALAAMHARGIVHRDVKPDNVFISMEDRTVQPKILDFGIAKLNAARGVQGNLSESGMLVGSPEYMSPEQAMACDDIDFRTDIWSVCVALYEAMSGTTPFAVASDEALLVAITELEPASLAEFEVCDELLWQIIRIGLAKDRYARHASMAELGRALASWLVGHGVAEDACGISLESRWFADDPVPPFAPPAPVNDAEITRPGLREMETSEAAPPSNTRTDSRMRTRRRPVVRATKALALAAVLAASTIAATQKYAPPNVIAIGKVATDTGTRLAASLASRVLAFASPADNLRDVTVGATVATAAVAKVFEVTTGGPASREDVAAKPVGTGTKSRATTRGAPRREPVPSQRRRAEPDLLVPY